MTTQTATTGTKSTWKIDPAHTLVVFSAKHMMFTTVKGRFTGIQGAITDVADDPARSSVEVEIAANSISTGDAKRDEHLRSADFLDVEKYPTLTFKSKRVEGKSADHFKVVGDLTIRGTTREVVLDTTSNGRGKNPWGVEVAGFTAEATLNRKDFGLTWNVALETGGVLVGDSIKLLIEMEAAREA